MDIGKKIKQLRIEKELTQSELATRCELSKGFISQVERNLTSPSIATLVDILEILGTNLKDFFNEKEQEQIVFSKQDIFITEDNNLKYKLSWIVPNAQKNLMEPILLELQPQGEYKEHEAHQGEEFGYILSGIISIKLGKKTYKAKRGECFYYKANTNHSILNIGKGVAKVLWISTPPFF